MVLSDTPTFKLSIRASKKLAGMVRGRGRKPANWKQLITARLKEGFVMMRRGIFRRFNKLFKADKEIRLLIESGHLDYVHLREVLEWALKTETVYENKHQKGIRNKRQQKQKVLNASSNLLNSVAYKYSKKAMECFFRDDRLRSLFLKYAPKIKEEGYRECKNRRNNRVGCKPAPSVSSSPSKSGIVGHSIALPKESFVSTLPDLSQTVDSSDELSDEHNDFSDQSNDMNDDDDSSEEEKAP